MPGAHAAIKQHFDATANRIRDCRQRRNRRARTVKLTAAVIRDDDCIGTARCPHFCIVDIEQAFQDQLARPSIAHPIDIVPGERAVELLAIQVAYC